MSGIKVWVLTVCIAALVCAAVQMLIPKNATGKVFRLVLAAAFLLCLLQPLSAVFSVDFPSDFGDISEDTALSKTLKKQLCRQIETTVYHYCEQNGFSPQKVEAVTDISSDERIYMKQIRLYIKRQDAERAGAVRQFLERDIGIAVEVMTEDEDRQGG